MSTLTRRPGPGPAGPAARKRRPALGLSLVLVETAAFAVILGAGGTPAGRAVRVGIGLAVGLAAVAAERPTVRPAWRGAAAVLLGLAGLVTGAGIGVLHVVKSDVTPVAVAALVALASGLGLLGIGVARLWRGTPGWWRLLALPVAFVLVEFAVIPGTVAVYATTVPHTRLDPGAPADRGLAYEQVEFGTADGVRLSAWYVPGTNGAAVVALHGAGSTRTGVLDQAAVLARHGYGVLLPDARGHGRSGGTAMDLGWWGDRDVAAAVRWLQGRPEVRPGRIGALGLSMGGEEAIGAAAGNPGIRAVVAEGALWRGSMDAGWLPTTVRGRIERGMLAVQTTVADLLTDAPRPAALRSAVRALAPRRLLLIAGRPEIDGDRSLRAAAPGTVQLWELPDTPHVQGLSRHPGEWEFRVLTFLDDTLLGR